MRRAGSDIGQVLDASYSDKQSSGDGNIINRGEADPAFVAEQNRPTQKTSNNNFIALI